VKFRVGNVPDYKSGQNVIESLTDLGSEFISKHRANIEFYNDLSSNGFAKKKPFYYQATRIKAALEDGRVPLRDDTGTGKTYVAVLTKLLMDKEKGRRHRALVVCTKGGMSDPWNEKEINSYANGDRQTIHYVKTKSDLKDVNKGYDFVVANYEKWAIRDYAKALTDQKWDLVIFDECHEMKNPKTKRSGWSAKETMRKGLCKFLGNYKGKLIVASATPIDKLNDMGMLLYALDPVNNPDPTAYDYEKDPSRLYKTLLRYPDFQIKKEDLREQLGLPDVPKEQIKQIKLSDREVETYAAEWERFLKLGEKLSNLEKALLDYRLVTGDYSGPEPAKYKELDKMLKEKIEDRINKRKKPEKFVIFTTLQNGITEKLEERYAKYGAVRVDGKIKSETKREKAIERFRYGKDNVMICTTGTMAESRSLATGDTPCSIVLLEPPFALTDWKQTIGRVYRPHQKARVNWYTFVAECDGRMRRAMDGALQRIRKEYEAVIGPMRRSKSKINYETIDEGKIKIRDYKQAASDMIFESGEKLSDILKQAFEAGKIDQCKSLLFPKTSSASQELCKYFSNLWYQGADKLKSALDSPAGRRKAEIMSEDIEYVSSGYASKYIGQVIESLDNKGYKAKRIVDIGCGPGTLSRIMHRPMACVDFSKNMIGLAKAACKKLGIRNEYVAAYMQKTGLPSGRFDVAVNSYVMHYQAQGLKDIKERKNGKIVKVDKEYREIDDALHEANRILRKGGTYIISLPPARNNRRLDGLVEELDYYGFDTKFSGFVKPSKAVDIYGRELTPRFRGYYLILAQKARKAPSAYPSLKRVLQPVQDFVLAFGLPKKRKAHKKRLYLKEQIAEYEIEPDEIAAEVSW